MLNYSRRPTIINPNARKSGRVGIVVQDEFEYFSHLNKLIEHHKELIEVALADYETLEFPVTPRYLEALLSGYTLEYHPFSNANTPELEGFRLPDPEDNSKIHIYYNINCSHKRQLYTKIHETIHVCQLLDPYFLDYVDWLMQQPHFPEPVVTYLLERVTDKVTAMYIMPERYFKKQYIENPNPESLSDFFHASVETVKIRMQELRLPAISKI